MFTVAQAHKQILDSDTQDLIEAMVVKHGLQFGIGNMAGADVRQHLQAITCDLARRYDGSTKFTTFIYLRIRGACIELLRVNAAKTRMGNLRPRFESMDVVDAQDTFEDEEIVTEFADAELLADLTLALQAMPARLRLVLYLLYYEHLPEAAAAERLAISLDGLRELRDRALNKCRLALLSAS